MIEQEFLKFSADRIEQQARHIQDCVGRLSDEQVWTRKSENENSVGNLVLHLCGNVRQWIGYGVGDLADQRDRGAEFAARGGLDCPQLLERLRNTVSQASAIIRNFDTSRLLDKVTIQNNEVTKMHAIYQVVQHFSQHTGQIIFITKLLTGQDLGYFAHLNPPKAARLP